MTDSTAAEFLEQAHRRLVAQALQITRLHSALGAISRSGSLSDPQVAMARAALEACEADAGQIRTDVLEVLSEFLPLEAGQGAVARMEFSDLSAAAPGSRQLAGAARARLAQVFGDP